MTVNNLEELELINFQDISRLECLLFNNASNLRIITNYYKLKDKQMFLRIIAGIHEQAKSGNCVLVIAEEVEDDVYKLLLSYGYGTEIVRSEVRKSPGSTYKKITEMTIRW